MEIQYVADDGAVFYDEKECLDYERGKNLMKENLICLDEDLRLLNNDNLDFSTDVYFILAKDDLTCEALEAEFDRIVVDQPEQGFKPNIIYWWNDSEMAWFILQEELKELREKVKFFEKALTIMHSS